MEDYSLLTRERGRDFVMLLVYVDDVIIAETSYSLIQEIKEFIHMKFQINDLGILKYFLGLELARSAASIFLNQQIYTLELLEESGFINCKPSSTPMERKHKSSLPSAPKLVDDLYYRRLVGKLIYLTITRPDLAYLIHFLSHFIQNPTEEQHQGVHRVLHYVKKAHTQGISFSSSSELKLQT